MAHGSLGHEAVRCPGVPRAESCGHVKHRYGDHTCRPVPVAWRAS